MTIKTVRELRKELEKLPDDLPVAFYAEFGATDIEEVTIQFVEPEIEGTLFRSTISVKRADRDHDDWIKTAMIS